MSAYPNYSKFFSEIDGKCALHFWKTYPSPLHLEGKTAEELTEELKEISKLFRKDKAEFILACVQTDGNTYRDYQTSRDFISRSLVKDLEHQKESIAELDKEIEQIHDTPDSRQLLGNHLNGVLKDSTNIVGTEVRSYVAKELPGTPTISYTATAIYPAGKTSGRLTACESCHFIRKPMLLRTAPTIWITAGKPCCSWREHHRQRFRYGGRG